MPRSLMIVGAIVAFFAVAHLAIPARFKTGDPRYYSDVEAAIREFQSRRGRLIRLTLILLGLVFAVFAASLLARFSVITSILLRWAERPEALMSRA